MTKLPPLFLRLRMRGAHASWPTLWVPLFMLWPLLFALLLPFAAIGLCALCVIAPHLIGDVVRIAGACYGLICELRGTRVDMLGERSELLVAIC